MRRSVPYKTIGRLSMYRRLLRAQQSRGLRHVYSHGLAEMAGATAAQVRRDLMSVGASGSPAKGYEITALIERLGLVLEDPEGQRVALVGVGNLGRAVLTFFQGRRPKLAITAAFDADPTKVNRVICGCRCYPMDRLSEVVQAEGIRIGIVAVPVAAAQEVAESLEAAGVCGLLNFAPRPLRIGPDTFIDDIDMTTVLERVAYFSRQKVSG